LIPSANTSHMDGGTCSDSLSRVSSSFTHPLSCFILFFSFLSPFFLPVPCVWPACGYTHSIAAAPPCGLDAPARADAGRDQDFPLKLLSAVPPSLVIISEDESHAHDYIPKTNGRTAIMHPADRHSISV
jgi:hypothetical protein